MSERVFPALIGRVSKMLHTPPTPTRTKRTRRGSAAQRALLWSIGSNYAKKPSGGDVKSGTQSASRAMSASTSAAAEFCH